MLRPRPPQQRPNILAAKYFFHRSSEAGENLEEGEGSRAQRRKRGGFLGKRPSPCHKPGLGRPLASDCSPLPCLGSKGKAWMPARVLGRTECVWACAPVSLTGAIETSEAWCGLGQHSWKKPRGFQEEDTGPSASIRVPETSAEHQRDQTQSLGLPISGLRTDSILGKCLRPGGKWLAAT